MSDLVEQQSAVATVMQEAQPPSKEQLATNAVKSGSIKGLTYTTAMMIMQLSEEIGIPPAQGLGSMHIINGKLVMSANLVAALVQRSNRFRYKVNETTDKACEIEYFERLGERDGLVVWDSLGKFKFTIEMAKRAELTGKAIWRQYPENMLYCRAMTAGVRMFCPSLTVVACYDPEEAESFSGASAARNGNARTAGGGEARNYEDPRALVRSVQEAN
jgi:hypothetical protein